MSRKNPPGMWVYLILCNALILCVSFFCILKTGLSGIAETAEIQTAQNLRTFAHSLAVIIPGQSPDVDSFLKDLALNDPGFRISVIDRTGRVIGDSDAPDTPALENHRYREEVAEALAGREKMTMRTSTVNKKRVMYYAIPFDCGGGPAALRLAVPLETTVLFSTAIRSDVIVVFVCILAAALCASMRTAAYIGRQIHELQHTAAQYAAGNFGYRPDIAAPRELRQLAESFGSMALQIKNDIRDISRRRDDFQAVFNGTTEGLIVFDRTMTVLKYNRAAAQFFSVNAQPAAAQPAGAQTPAAQTAAPRNGAQPATGEPLIQIVRNAEIQSFAAGTACGAPGTPDEISVQLHNAGGVRDMLVRCVPIGDDPQNSRYLLIINDITKIRRLEQIRKDFVANVSHELKTPVTAIKGFAETLLDDSAADTETQRQFLSIINAQSGRLINIIEDLLTLSRLDQESELPQAYPGDIAELTKGICGSFCTEAAEKNIALTFTAPPQPLTVNLNAGLYSHAVGNLLENAIKYCPENSAVTCSVERRDNGYAVVAVEDNGPGIPGIYRERIFERFFRVDKGRSREHGGTGLGLSITSHIAKIHGGTVTALGRSDGKPGARFELSLPLAEHDTRNRC